MLVYIPCTISYNVIEMWDRRFPINRKKNRSIVSRPYKCRCSRFTIQFSTKSDRVYMIYSLFHVSKQTNITCPSFNYHDVTIPSLQNPTKISVNIESTQHCIARKIDRHIFRSNIDLGGQGWNHWTRNDEFYKNAKRDRKWLGVIWGSRGAKTVKKWIFSKLSRGFDTYPSQKFPRFFLTPGGLRGVNYLQADRNWTRSDDK